MAKKAKTQVRVCASRSCTAFGSRQVMEKIQAQTGLNPGENNATLDLDWCGCLGYCSRSPNIAINDSHIIFAVDPDTVMEKIAEGGEDMKGNVIDVQAQFDDLFKNDTL